MGWILEITYSSICSLVSFVFVFALLFQLYLFSSLVLLVRCEIPVCVYDVIENNVVSLVNMDVLGICRAESNLND